MQNTRETVVSLFGAVIVCGGLLAISTTVVLWDASALRRQVQQLFAVDFFKAPPPVPPQQQTAELAGRQLVGESIGLFAKAPEKPEIDAAQPENLPVAQTAQIPAPAQAVAGLTLPAAELPRLAGVEVRKGGGGGEEEVLALRRKLSAPESERAARAFVREGVRDGAGAGGGRKLERETPAELALPAFRMPEQPEPLEQRPAAQPAAVALPAGGTELTRDLVRYRPDGGYPSLDREIRAEFSQEQSGGETFFRLSFRLRPESRLPVLPKDVLFLVDVSQSIGLAQIQAAREAITAYVRQLRPGDRWNVVKFSERVYTLSPGYVFLPAGREEFVAQAEKFLRRIPGEDMTDLFDATRSILRNAPETGRLCNVFLLSDGFANYNRSEVGQITDGFRRDRRDNFAIFTFMSSDFGKPDLLRLLSYRSRGFFERAPADAELAGRMRAFFLAYDRPVLTGCVANYTNLQAREVYPQVLPNLYAGQTVTFHGRANRTGDFVIRVMGYGEEGAAREFYFRPEAGAAQGTGIRPEWARGRAYGMVQDVVDAPDDAARARELQALRTFLTQEQLPDLAPMSQLLEKGR